MAVFPSCSSEQGETTTTTSSKVAAATTATTPAHQASCCFLCIEPLHHHANTVPPRTCCPSNNAELCQDCLYRHVMSILEDDLVGRFRSLSCPFGCGTPLTDTEVRRCIHRQHTTTTTGTGKYYYYVCLWVLVDWFRWFLYITLASLVSRTEHAAQLWWNIRLVHKERRDLQRYMAWSLQRGLADMAKKQDDLILLHCPGPDCDFQWIVGDARHRRAKQRHEMKPYLFWYAPYRGPDRTPSNFLYGPNAGDVRRMHCPACRTTFCGLCRNPWVYGFANHSYQACRDYTRLLPPSLEDESLADRFALAALSRACPGCTRRTERIDGCNHISCPCGTQWCYACGSRWNPTHYYCTDPQSSSAAGAPNCIIL